MEIETAEIEECLYLVLCSALKNLLLSVKGRSFYKGLKKSPSSFDIFFTNVKATGRFCQILVAYLENLNKILLNYLNTLRLSS